jgi:aconitate hydratase
MSSAGGLSQSKGVLKVGPREYAIYRLRALEEAGLTRLQDLPFSIRVLAENLLRHCDGYSVTEQDVRNVAGWRPDLRDPQEIPFKPARVVLQDFTGVPAVVDLAAMRSAMKRLGGDPARINPTVPVDLVIDHSVMVDHYGASNALQLNADLEFVRNAERYEFLRWGQKAFHNFQIVPPATGIVHQVNLEYLARCVWTSDERGETLAYPDTLVGTDSHTTMINGLGVVGWGVGGIEAEAVMLSQPLYMLLPEVVGFQLVGRLPEGATATDLVLTVTELLRKRGVVGKFVEFYGSGLSHLSLPDRATIANMAPEYGATMGFFPVDAETIRYLRQTGRSDETAELVEAYCREQSLFRTESTPDPKFTEVLTLDLDAVEPSLAGPKRPQDRVALSAVKKSFSSSLSEPIEKRGFGLTGDRLRIQADVEVDGAKARLGHGAVVIAAITSCTNTSNPSVMLAAGLVAQKAVARGLQTKPWVKTSLAPGSRVVTSYLQKSGLEESLNRLGFQTVGYGCTTCIGNSGPLPAPVAKAVVDHDIVAVAVLSGNRNFEGRVHPLVKANYLASPPLVVAFALAGRVDVDFATEPLGEDPSGTPVYLRDVWPTADEVRAIEASVVGPETYRERYGSVFSGNEMWNRIPAPESQLYDWKEASTYIQHPPFFQDLTLDPAPPTDILGARCLLKLGDSITTDHISPAGAIKADSPAGRYLIERGVSPADFNSYGSRRGNDRVMTRGTFANIRIRNQLVPGAEGGVTLHFPTGEVMPVYDAAVKYQQAGIPLVVLAGAEYGSGSSRDWAAKGTRLLGVRAVFAQSFERIHRSNLVGMGVLPLEFPPGESADSLGLTGRESFEVAGVADGLKPGKMLHVRAVDAEGAAVEFQAKCRIDTPVEVEYYRNGGILQTVLRKFAREGK